MKYCFAYITVKDKEEAKEIGRILIEEKLAACVNIISGMNSMYRWQGKIEYDSEVILIAKTKDKLV